MQGRFFPAWPLVIALVCVMNLCAAGASAADTVLYRLFLLDGTTLVSFGEFARVADRVVFSIPLGDTGTSPDLQLVSIPESSVDWDRTDKYADAVRAKRYGETRGENDFTLLGHRVAQALNDIALTADPKRRLAMAQEARGNLAQWPVQNFGYRAADVAQLVGMLDDVISDLRSAAGDSGFDLSLVATTPLPEPIDLLPAPDPRETMEQAFAASRATPEPAERLTLLQAIAAALKGPAQRGGWASALYGRVSSDLTAELKVEKSYKDLASSTIAAVAPRAARGDVNGVQAIVHTVLATDDRLGRKRPQETAALLALLDLRLDDARRIRLARDAWAMRLGAFEAYRRAIGPSLDELRHLKRPLEEIRELSGPNPRTLTRLEQRIVMAKQAFAAIDAPSELQAAQSLYGTAFQFAKRAATARRDAVSSKDIKLAWDASSAAAGALMLIDRAADELQRLTTPPPNR